jgi:energy-coupling factor transporter ATP-binding protein EcfA2
MKLNDFTTLFNEYRLKSQIETSSQFGEQLAEVGYAFEDSIFSKWKRGTRVPKNRDLLKAIITVFVKKRAITSLEQANELLRVLNHRDLTKEEADKIFIYGNKHSPFTAPNILTHKITREKYLKEVVWSLMNGQITIVHGISGSGKTTIAILTAHFLKDTYNDGVLWFRGDIKTIGSILEEIGSNYGEAPTPELSNETKSELVREILKNKDTLIIIDNVEEIEPIITYLAPKSEDKYRLLLTSIHTFNHSHELSKIKLSGFSKEEALNLSEMILGKAYVKANFDKIIDLNSKLEHSPLGITVLLKQLVEKPELLSKFLNQLNKGVFNLSSLQYDSKNLTQSLAIAYSLLKTDQQNLLSVIGIFKGTDFDTEAVAAILDGENNSVKKLVEELHQLSFIEQSRNGRYRLHPFVKIYLQSKITDLSVYKRLLEYYEVKFRPDRSDNPNTKRWILSEIENIIGAFEKCYECGQYKEVVQFWGKLCRYLWDSGRWSELDKYAQLTLKSANKLSDERSAASCNVKDLSWLYVWRNKLSKAEECLKTAYE